MPLRCDRSGKGWNSTHQEWVKPSSIKEICNSQKMSLTINNSYSNTSVYYFLTCSTHPISQSRLYSLTIPNESHQCIYIKIILRIEYDNDYWCCYCQTMMRNKEWKTDEFESCSIHLDCSGVFTSNHINALLLQNQKHKAWYMKARYIAT